jgi:copper resistance protein D
MEIDIPLIGARWLHFASTMLVFGASLFPIYAMPSRLGTADQAWLVATRRIVGWAACLAFVSGVAWVCRSLVIISGDIGGLVDPDTLSAFFFETSFGPVWIARLVLLLIAAGLAMRLSGSRDQRAGMMLLALVGGCALASQAWLGHAAMATGMRLSAELGCYMVHVLAAGAWIGGLVPLGLLLTTPAGQSNTTQGRLMAEQHQALLRFSNLGMVLVSLILASGIGNSVFRLGSARDLLATDYGRMILVKALLFAVMLSVAAFNRWRLMPRMEANGRRAVTSIRRNILVEGALGAVVLAVAAILGTLSPQA